jgi:hypothetical protein
VSRARFALLIMMPARKRCFFRLSFSRSFSPRRLAGAGEPGAAWSSTGSLPAHRPRPLDGNGAAFQAGSLGKSG